MEIRFAAFAAACVFVCACSGALAEPGELPAEPGAPHAPKTSSPPAPTGGSVPAPTQTTPPPAGDTTPKCSAFGVDAFLCDSFDPQMSSAWVQVLTGGELHAWTKNAASGTHALESAFDPLPAGVGRATLVYDAPFAPSPRPSKVAMQFTVQLPVDGYPTTLSLGGLRASSGADALSLALVGGGKRYALVDKLAGASTTHDLGAAQLGTWQCLELEVDATGAFRAWMGKTLAASGALAMGAAAFSKLQLAEVGLTYDAGASNDSIVSYYDDVVIAPAAVGCLH